MSDFKRIEFNGWYPSSGVTEYREGDHDEMAQVLLGHRVEKVDHDHLVLDDGTTILLVGHDGGCACDSGCYDLTDLNGVDNIITSVEFEDDPDDDYRDSAGTYRIFVFAGNEKVNLATFEGTDGNGYYGTGYHFLVRKEAK